LWAAIWVWLGSAAVVPGAETDAARWEETIQQFERQDRDHPPQPGGLLFVGSSSIRLWDVEKTLPGRAILNRGFGGSQMSDVLHYLDRIMLVYRPRCVVLYEGDNDIAAGEAAAQVADEFRQLAQRLHQALPDTRLVYLSIKPSLARWHLYGKMQQANQAIAEYCQQHDRCQFVDVSQVMLDAQGQPLKELFVEDGLHMNDEGYRRWSRLVEPLLK
jgi:lysophospholipase L1-like esterase